MTIVADPFHLILTMSLIPSKEELLPNLKRKVCALLLSQKDTFQLGTKICRDQGSLCPRSLLNKLFKLGMASHKGWSSNSRMGSPGSRGTSRRSN